MNRHRLKSTAILIFCFLAGAATHALFPAINRPAQAEPATTPTAATAAEIESIKGKLPDQSHAMQDVSYHFSNLWFAGQNENWPLAEFYNNETRSHLQWAVRIIPKRKDLAGREIDLQAILQAFETSPWTQIKNAIAAKDKPAFEKAYRFGLETCYACHKAADKPFLRPQIPIRPETPIINFDPKAQWP
jgi:hypothetical protein